MYEARLPTFSSAAQDLGPAVRTLLCVDYSNNLYKAAAANADLTSGDIFTGGVFGFMYFLAKAIFVTKATQVVMCKDCPPYVRSSEYPEYKMLRATNKDEALVAKVKETKALLDDLFDLIGIPVMAAPGYESDDLIGLLVRKYRHRFGSIVAASNDSDLYQLFDVCSGFSIYRGKTGFYDKNDFDREWGLSRDQFMEAHALMGTHNDIAGIDGVGPVRAKGIVLDPPKLRSYRLSHASLIERNKRLIELPHPTMDPTLTLPRAGKIFKEREFIRFMGRLDIKVSFQLLASLEKVLK